MHSLSSSNIEQVLSLSDSGHSAHQISTTTGHSAATITQLWSQHHPDVPKSNGGHPIKLSDTDIQHACHFISSGKADNCSQVTKMLQTVTNKSLSSETVHLRLKKAGWKAVMKKKRPMLSKHTGERRWTFQLVPRSGLWMTGRE